jgi:hypothetical protein
MQKGNTFYTKDNIELIVNIFTDYMYEKHDVSINKVEDVAKLKQDVFNVMTKVRKESSGNEPINRLNTAVLSIVKDVYLERLKTPAQKKPNMKSLERERDVFGNREVNVNELIPKRDPYMRRNIPNLDKLITERDDAVGTQKTPLVTKIAPQTLETAETADDFMLKLKDLERMRDQQLPATSTTASAGTDGVFLDRIKDDSATASFLHNIENHDPKSLFESTLKDMNPKPLQSYDEVMNTRESLIIPQNTNQILMSKYISVNSFDRDWKNESVLRYRYGVNFKGGDSMQNIYKNIRSIEVGKVIIPEEIYESATITNQNMKTQFNYEFSFSYPYVILQIAEFNDVYDGTNDTIRRAFCKLVYHRSYKAPNGRGFIVLKPLQDEKKIFHPTPLSSLNRLSISLLRPTGDLLNDSSDAYKLFKIEYEAFNPVYLHIVTDTYFDKNEFFKSDQVIIQDYVITSTTAPDAAKQLMDYINRREGHEVTDIGCSCENGFFSSFYIRAPGVFDKKQGKFIINQDVIECLNSYNAGIDYRNVTTSNGSIMNFSLQNTIGLKLEHFISDAMMSVAPKPI